MIIDKGYFKWKKVAAWVSDPNGKFKIDDRGMVLKEGEGTVLIKGFDPIEQIKKIKGDEK